MADGNQDLRKAIMRVCEKTYGSGHRRTRTNIDSDLKGSSSGMPMSQQVLQKLMAEPSTIQTKSSNRSTILDRTTEAFADGHLSKTLKTPVLRTMLHKNKGREDSQNRLFLGNEIQNLQYLRYIHRSSQQIQYTEKTPTGNSSKPDGSKGFSKLSEKRKAADSLRNNSALRLSTPETPKIEDKSDFPLFPLIEFYEKTSLKASLAFYEKVICRLTEKVKHLREDNLKLKSQNKSIMALQQQLVAERVDSFNQEQQT